MRRQTWYIVRFYTFTQVEVNADQIARHVRRKEATECTTLRATSANTIALDGD